jgi:hypothetical protein
MFAINIVSMMKHRYGSNIDTQQSFDTHAFVNRFRDSSILTNWQRTKIAKIISLRKKELKRNLHIVPKNCNKSTEFSEKVSRFRGISILYYRSKNKS